jgi:hypothetical protein
MTPSLLDEVERFLTLTGMKPTAFSVAATGGRDRHFVRTLRAGRQTWPATQERVRQFMNDYALAKLAEARDAADAG